jgi:DNA-binding NarL/FixJ family response regulator
VQFFSEDDSMSATAADGPTSRTSGSPIEVWLVEDSAHLRETVREYLDMQKGLRCGLAVESCEEALDALRRGRVPDAVLVDLNLPGMSGLEGIAQIRSLSPSTQVVVLTIREDDQTVFEALCAGASGYLLKPASGQRIAEAFGPPLPAVHP